jgi:tight adherence protein B
MDYAQLILISVFGSLTVYFVVRMMIPQSEKEIVEQRVSKYFKGSNIDDVADEVIQERQKKKDTGKTGRVLVSKDFSEYILSSGIKLTPSEFIYAWLGLVFIPMILLTILGVNPITIVGVTLIGFVIPPFLLKRARQKTQDIFTKQLGEALVIMGNAVRGGFSFRQAMDGIARDMQPPISSEFAMTIREITYGVSQLDALQHMTARVKNPDLDLLVCAVSISAQVGGNLSDILDIIATTIKDRIRIKQEVKVLSASGRMSALIIGLLPVVLVVALMIVNPSYFAGFLQSPIGIILAVVSVIMEIIGFLIIRKISDVRY